MRESHEQNPLLIHTGIGGNITDNKIKMTSERQTHMFPVFLLPLGDLLGVLFKLSAKRSITICSLCGYNNCDRLSVWLILQNS